MKFVIFSAAALAAVAMAPALAQTAPATDHSAHGKRHEMRMAPMTRAQVLEKVQTHFAKVDADNDGVVTKAEMEAMRSARHERKAGQDGKAGREGKAGHARMHAGMHGKMFAMADGNNDGRVSLQEATAAAAAHFDRADANRDGTLTPEEMRAAHKAHKAKPAS